jgi:hypothetical protein
MSDEETLGTTEETTGETTEAVAEESGTEALGEEQEEEQEEETQEETPEEIAAREKEEEDRKRRNELAYHRRKAEQAQARAEAVQRELEELRATRQPTPENRQAASGEKPKIEDYETWDEFLDARDDWNRKQWEGLQTESQRRQEAKAWEAQERKRWDGLRQSYNTAEAQLRKEVGEERAAEYDKVIDRMTEFLVDDKGVFTNPALAEALFAAGPKVAWEFGEDLERVEKQVSAGPLEIGRELGKIEAQINDRGRRGRKFSKAPPPEPRLKGQGRAGPIDPMKMTDREYRRWRNKQDGIAE